MKPAGRRFFKCKNSKHKVKTKGKHVKAWWEDVCQKDKNSDKQQVKKDIKNEIELE